MNGGEIIKKFFLIVFLLNVIFIHSVYASEVYYKNSNDVAFSKCEYDFISNFTWEGFQTSMTSEDFSNIFRYADCNNVIESDFNSVSTFGTIHVTQNKSLKISKSCATSYCSVSTVLKWINLPTVRSYDLIGVYFRNTSLENNGVITYVNNSPASEIKRTNNGFGVSVKLPTGNNAISVTQIFTVKKTGTVYASYQHAVRSVTLATSKKYSISFSGYGSVFLFENGVNSYYDAMGGVNITL